MLVKKAALTPVTPRLWLGRCGDGHVSCDVIIQLTAEGGTRMSFFSVLGTVITLVHVRPACYKWSDKSDVIQRAQDQRIGVHLWSFLSAADLI